MSRTRPSRAAARTLRLLLLASLVMLGPLAAAPSHAWTPPPAPLPMEPGDTDGMEEDDYYRAQRGTTGQLSSEHVLSVRHPVRPVAELEGRSVDPDAGSVSRLLRALDIWMSLWTR